MIRIEFIAANAGNERVARGRLQPARHLLQQRVSRSMPVDIVGLFKAVEIDGREWRTARRLSSQHARSVAAKCSLKAARFGRLGQRIEVRHMSDALFRTSSLLRDIIKNCEQVLVPRPRSLRIATFLEVTRRVAVPGSNQRKLSGYDSRTQKSKSPDRLRR